MDSFNTAWDQYKTRAELALRARLPAADANSMSLHQAIRYACLDGGKRFRAMLVYVSGQTFGASLTQLDAAAAAVEIIHAYSLIHDDLPAMDNDDIRRGRPSCHKAFDEATAILAGDGAQCLAFSILAEDPSILVDDSLRLKMIRVLADASGISGMVGGQALDMQATQQSINAQQLTQLHQMKTGALIKASCQLGGLCVQHITDEQLTNLGEYGIAIGLAFQIRDDILDVTQNSDMLGKPSGADARMEKSTYVSLFGLEHAQHKCQDLYQQAVESADRLGDNSAMFRQLADFVVSRSF